MARNRKAVAIGCPVAQRDDPRKSYWSLEEAFRFCERITRGHYENFPVGSWLIPRAKRNYVHSIYAFARTADDFADEPDPGGDRLVLLDGWEKELEECYQGQARHPIFLALKQTVTRLGIPIEPLKDLITAFKMDVTVSRYTTFDDVLNYCRFSANPVGRLVLYLFNYRDEQVHNLSDQICTGLQLTNFWQDVAVDLEKNRVYLPLEEMKQYGYSPEELFSRRVNGPFKELMRFQVERTRGIFERGRPLCRLVGRDLALELKLTWLGGMRILEMIEAVGYDVFDKRPAISSLDKLRLLIRALLFWSRAGGV